MKNKIFCLPEDATLIICRLIIGGIFIVSGFDKVGAIATTVTAFSKMGIPSILTYIVAYGELIGGILLVIGLWVEYAAAFLTIVMLVAVYVTYPAGIRVFGYPLSVIAGLVAILGFGPGKYKVGSKF
ncbi:MAG: DoxX family protein [Candidatus Taylorbacteria bacterium]|nr:DoxX family protein [Candidatus Taylorbacteria bacterium]